MTMTNDLARSPAVAGLDTRSRLSRPFRAMFDRSTLPPDVIDEEVTEVICFKASLVLNRAFGGKADMTFSARIHMAARQGRTAPRRCVWACAEMAVDAACGMLRGEAHHCETAWINYCRRPSVKNG